MQRTAFMLVALASWAFAPSMHAADWPQHRFDAGRTAASAAPLPAQLHLQWVRDLAPPRPAFASDVRLRFDATYEPVVLGKTMFVPSMVTDSVTAIDTDTGAQRWRFFADGPVRFAPVAWGDRVCFASDDGYLYCLHAKTGQLVWRFRGLPTERQDRKVFGHGRLISLWPARGGPVLADGVIYFAAGIWPSDGVFIHALEAASGKVIWSNTDSHRIAKANLDHGVKGQAGLTPQGYLVVAGDQLIVPCGAQLPAFLDRKTGKLQPYTMGWGGRTGLPKGTSFVAAVGRYMISSGDLFDITTPNREKFKESRGRPDFKSLLYPGGYTRLQIDPTNQKDIGDFRRPVLTPEAMYYRTTAMAKAKEAGKPGGVIVAEDLKKLAIVERSKAKKNADRRNDRYPDKLTVDSHRLWGLRSDLKIHIKAGPRLYAAGPGVVQAIDVPQGAGEPKVSWRAKIDGTPRSVLAADDKLFVVTDQGRIYSFGGRADVKPTTYAQPQPSDTARDDRWTATAARILKQVDVTDGYALVLGIEGGRLVEELVRKTSFHVIAFDRDAAKIAALRQRMQQAGLYGTRVTAHVSDPLAYPFPPYMANLVTSENAERLAKSFDQAFARSVFHPLRPYGGAAVLALPTGQADAAVAAMRGAELAGAQVQQADGLVRLTRSGPLPGSADWSHDGGNAANAGASQDEFVKGSLGILWFDASLRWHRQPGSTILRVASGRILVAADDLQAIDAYTGRRMWHAALPAPSRARSRADVVAVDDAIYITNGPTCLVLDPKTGRKTGQIKRPAKVDAAAGAAWSDLRVWKQYLVGAFGRYVVCVDRRTGDALWSFEARNNQLGLAVGGETVFCSELPNPRRRGASKGGRTVALEIKTGKVRWQGVDGTQLRYSEPHDLLVTANGVYLGKDGTRIRNSGGALPLAGDKMIGGDDDTFIIYDLPGGSKLSEELNWYRRGCTNLRAAPNIITTRFKGNAAYIDLATRQITRLWNIRSGCFNNIIPADGVLNVPSVTGGCTCNYSPTSMGWAPRTAIERNAVGN